MHFKRTLESSFYTITRNNARFPMHKKKTSLGSKTFEKPSIHFRFIVRTTLYTPCFSGIRSMLLNGFCPVYRQRFLCLIQARIGNPFLDCPSSFGGDIEHQKVGHFGQCPLFLPQTFESLMRITGTFFRFSHFELSGYNGNNGHVFTKKPELAFRVLKAISGMKFLFFCTKPKTLGQFPFHLPVIPFHA